jgi:excisionase family DNA binding protein
MTAASSEHMPQSPEAAEILGLSRPTVVELIDSGKIRAVPGVSRGKVLLTDLAARALAQVELGRHRTDSPASVLLRLGGGAKLMLLLAVKGLDIEVMLGRANMAHPRPSADCAASHASLLPAARSPSRRTVGS